MANWFVLRDGAEAGPLTFQELAAEIASQRVSASDFVRRESGDWEAAEDVIGLLRAARQLETGPSAADLEFPIGSHEQPAADTGRNCRADAVHSLAARILHALFGGRRQLTVTGSLCVVAVCLGRGIHAWLSQPEAFPAAPPAVFQTDIPDVLEQMRPPVPKQPTLPNLKTLTPVRVPGLEALNWLKCPTLTHDLTVIVFVTYRGEETQDDLMIATRPSAAEPFGEPSLLESTVTPSREAHPALSPDGLQLAYAVHGDPHRLWITTRHSLEEPFDDPRPLEIDNDVTELHHDAPQLLEGDRLMYTVYDDDYRQRSILFAEKTSTGRFIRTSERLPVADPYPRYQLCGRGRRVYFPAEDGIYISARHVGRGEFVLPARLIDGAQLGAGLTAFDDRIWVAPAEDLLFYCSSGIAPDSPDVHQLWMIRF